MRKSLVHMYWAPLPDRPTPTWGIFWQLVDADGRVMCQSAQGFHSTEDALKNIQICGHHLFGVGLQLEQVKTRITGPGKKPK